MRFAPRRQRSSHLVGVTKCKIVALHTFCLLAVRCISTEVFHACLTLVSRLRLWFLGYSCWRGKLWAISVETVHFDTVREAVGPHSQTLGRRIRAQPAKQMRAPRNKSLSFRSPLKPQLQSSPGDPGLLRSCPCFKNQHAFSCFQKKIIIKWTMVYNHNNAFQTEKQARWRPLK